MNALARISAQNKVALQEGLKIVRKVVATNPHPTGFTTAELFKLALKEAPPASYKYEPIVLRSPTHGKTGSQRSPEPTPPRSDHPIKSIRFLKKSILPVMEGQKELQIVRTTRIPFNPAPTQRPSGGKRKGKQEAPNAAAAAPPAPVTVWVWKAVEQKMRPRAPATPRPPRKVFGAEVGVGEDWSHLSRRRQRTRLGKVRRDVKTVKAILLMKKQKAVVEANRQIRMVSRMAAKSDASRHPLPTPKDSPRVSQGPKIVV